VRLEGALRDELFNLIPGQVLALRGAAGRDYAIMEMEDFLHILDRAGMDVRNSAWRK
jgi:hypothetical protein